MEYDIKPGDEAYPIVDAKLFRDACAELHIKEYAMSRTSQPNIQKYVVLKPNYLCNYISSTIYALSSIKFLRAVVKETY